MHMLAILLSQLLIVTSWTRAEDVGLDYDPADLISWENDYGDYPYRTFYSSDLTPPAVVRRVDSPECHDGLYTFLTPRGTGVNESRGMVMLDDEEELVWMHSTNGQPYNFNVQMYRGLPHLTYWLGDDTVGGHGEGDYYILNSSYQVVAQISGQNDLRPDLHTLSLTPDDTAIITAYQQYNKEEDDDMLYIWDSLFQEIDIASKEVLFEWRASDHHTLNESFHKQPHKYSLTNKTSWDWFHLNSVQKDDMGNYLVSARYTHSLSYIDGRTGQILWILGGVRNMFTSDNLAYNFSSQHYAQFHSVDEFPSLADSLGEDEPGMITKLITLFDNRRDDRWVTDLPSRGLLLSVTFPSNPRSDQTGAYTARILQEYLHPNQLSADSQGALQVVPSSRPDQDPTILIGWGARPVWSSYISSGKLLCDTYYGTKHAILNGTVSSYRVTKHDWVGMPNTSPSAVFGDYRRKSVFVSWNGATEVDSWALQHSDASDENAGWVYVSITPKDGFETEIPVRDCVTRFLRVVALDVQDNVLGVSNAIEMDHMSDLRCNEMDNILFSPNKDVFVFGGVTMTPIGVIMVAMSMTMFAILSLEFWKMYKTWKRRRDYHYYRLEVDPYL